MNQDEDAEYFDEYMEEDDPEDSDYAQEHTNGDPNGAGVGLIDFSRHGRKKAFAPYMTIPVILREFFEESVTALEAIEHNEIIQRMFLSVAPENNLPAASTSNPAIPVPRINTVDGAEKLSEIRKIQALGLNDAKFEWKVFFNKMKELRRRVESAGVLEDKVKNLTDCLIAAPNLQTLKNRKEEHDYASKSASCRLQLGKSFYSMPYVEDAIAKTIWKYPQITPMPRELIVTVIVYQGQSPMLKLSNSQNIRQSCVLHCLGSSTLADVVRFISCPADNFTAGPEQSEFSFAEDVATAADLENEKMMLVEGAFFTNSHDLQKSRALHYQQWCRMNDVETSDEVKVIDGPQIQDIRLRLGAPYLYKHALSGCEHHVVFSDARMLHSDDDPDLTHYPRIIHETKRKYPQCVFCKRRSSYHVTNSKRYPNLRNCVCDPCNRSFNYDANGNLVEPDISIIPLFNNDEEVDDESNNEEDE